MRFGWVTTPSRRVPAVFEREAASTPLHEERLNVVARLPVESGPTTFLDPGCGSGALLCRLLDAEQLIRNTGLDRHFSDKQSEW